MTLPDPRPEPTGRTDPPPPPVLPERAPAPPDPPAPASSARVDTPTGESPAARPEATEPAPPDDPGAGPEGRSLRSDLHEVAGARPERAFNVGAVLGIVLTVAAVVFVIQNSGATDFEFLWFDFSLPLWTVLVGTLAVGVLLTLAAFGLHRRRRRRIGRREEATGRLERALTTDDPDPEPATEPHRRRFRFPGRRPTPA